MEVIYRNGPLDNKSKQQQIILKKDLSINGIINNFKLKDKQLQVKLNGNVVDPEHFQTITLKKNDYLVLTPFVSGGNKQETAKIVGTVLQIALLVVTYGGSAALSAGYQAAIMIGGTLIIQGIRQAILAGSEGDTASQKNTELSASQNHSIDSSGNEKRYNRPMMMIFGETRVFPDHNANAYYISSVGPTKPISNAGGEYVALGFETIGTNLNQAGAFGTNIAFGADAPIIINGVAHTFRSEIENGVYNINPADVKYRIASSGRLIVAKLLSPDAEWESLGSALRIQLATSGAPPTYYADVRFSYSVITGPIGSPYFGKAAPSRHLRAWAAALPGQPDYPPPIFIDTKVGATGYHGTFSVARHSWRAETLISSTVDILKQTFNYGLGDITISDSRIGQTSVSDYHDVTDTLTNKNNWITFIDQNMKSDTMSKLNTDKTSSGKSCWTTRRSPKRVNRITMNLTGRVYNRHNNLIGALSFDIAVQYKLIASAEWLDISTFNTFVASTVSTSNVTTGVCNFNALNLNDYRGVIDLFVPIGQYDYRVRLVHRDYQNKDETLEISIPNIRYNQIDNSDYTAQNLYGLSIRASEQINGTVERINALAQAKCFKYDGVADTYSWDYTDNPADWFLYFAKGLYTNNVTQNVAGLGKLFFGYDDDNLNRIFGGAYKDSEIDIEKIKSWAMFCTANNLKIGGVQKEGLSILKMLNKIANLGRGSASILNGKLTVVYEDPNQAVVAMITGSNIIKDTFTVQYNSSIDLPDKIICTFTDKNNDYNIGTVEALSPFFAVHDRQPKEFKVDLWGVTDSVQAQRECNLLAAKQIYQRRKIGFEMDIEGLFITRGDVVYLSHDLTQWDFSGRILNFDIVGVLVLGARLSRAINNCTVINIRQPNGSMNEYNITVSADGLNITFVTPYNIEDASNNFAESSCNPLSMFENSVPEDFIFIAGPLATTGKKIKIVSVEPQGLERVRISAIDEEPAYYGYEFDQIYIEPENKSRTVIKTMNACVVSNENGLIKVEWDSVGCFASQILISINGGVATPLITGGSFSYYDNKINFTEVPGNSISLEIIPYALNTAFIAESTSINFVVN